MDLDIKYTVYSIIENIISKPVNGKKKICDLVNYENYKQTEIIDALSKKFNIIPYEIDNLCIDELVKILRTSSIDDALEQQFQLWCERYMNINFNNKSIIKYLEGFDIKNEYIQIIKNEAINIELPKKYKYCRSKKWWIYFSIDIFNKYKWQIPKKY